MRWKSDREDEFFYLKLFLGLVVVIAAIAGLIEWNARRQAAAFTRELMRPATPEEQRKINQMLRAPEDAGEALRARDQVSAEVQAVPPHSTPLGHPPSQSEIAQSPIFEPQRRDDPIFMDERCIDGGWYRREGSEWKLVGKCY